MWQIRADKTGFSDTFFEKVVNSRRACQAESGGERAGCSELRFENGSLVDV
jgi:hypothetical protein